MSALDQSNRAEIVGDDRLDGEEREARRPPEAGVAVVIADGSFNTPSERAALRSTSEHDQGFDLRHPASLVRGGVAPGASHPTRGLSCDPGFLGPYLAT